MIPHTTPMIVYLPIAVIAAYLIGVVAVLLAVPYIVGRRGVEPCDHRLLPGHDSKGYMGCACRATKKNRKEHRLMRRPCIPFLCGFPGLVARSSSDATVRIGWITVMAAVWPLWVLLFGVITSRRAGARIVSASYSSGHRAHERAAQRREAIDQERRECLHQSADSVAGVIDEFASPLVRETLQDVVAKLRERAEA